LENVGNNIIAFQIGVEGLVQGVGFRPFVYRLARQHGLQGWVVNRTDGLTIKIEGPAACLPGFMEDLRNKAPVASQIDEITIEQDEPEGLHGFFILASQDMTQETSEISPDIAVCPDCLEDMKNQSHRRDYPFVNCTNCGPRFTIVKDFPYDRKKTTMAPFTMCDQCNEEYTDIGNRRFHAQPVACNNCGPVYTLHCGSLKITSFAALIEFTSSMVMQGKTIAVKGVGGFHLMCDAMNEDAVSRLRKLKQRDGKPFAVMFRDLETIRQYALVSEAEALSLTSWRRPIVVLNTKQPLAAGLSPGLNTVGAFLPYMPFHHLLFEKLVQPALVLTSGNIAEEPIVIRNEEALETLSEIADAVITYNREIYNRTDDSVVRIIGGKERIVRRSRGYTPLPVKLDFRVDGILAVGAELSNTFCIGKGNRAYLSQHIGDLKNHETHLFYEETLNRFQQLFRIKPRLVAADLHPDYLSTVFARKLGLGIISVQHHHAHIASCMAENRLNEPVIGLAFDGTGLGADGHSWGSEFMVCDFMGYDRKSHFEYMAMPGGDRAAEEPWRMGLSLLQMVYGSSLVEMDLPVIKSVDKKIIARVSEAILKQINSPLSSGAGRLFDGIAAITGVCIHAQFHAEAPMRLESLVMPGIYDCYDVETGETISFKPAIRQICHDMLHLVPVAVIATRFHNTVTEASWRMIRKIQEETGIRKVVLSGGTFQNKYLFESLENKLVKDNFAVYTHSQVPCNDGGIALGQLAVAAQGYDQAHA
jgi:hydrogenase maturation protein HypF